MANDGELEPPGRGLLDYAVDHRALGTLAMAALGFVFGFVLVLGWNGEGPDAVRAAFALGGVTAVLFGLAGFMAPKSPRARRARRR